MSECPRISVITPSYNQGEHIEESILSVISQNYPNLEYIIIDGGSTDNSVEIIKKYEEHLAYWCSKPDKGIYDAMNKGSKRATGEWLYFLGTDDRMCTNVLRQIFIENQYHQSVDFLYGNVLLVPSKKLYGKRYSFNDLAKRTICHQAIFVKKTVLHKVGYFNISYKIAADYAFVIKCFGKSEFIKYYMDITVAEYYEGGISGSAPADIEFQLAKPYLLKKFLRIEDYKNSFSPIATGERGFMYIIEGNYLRGFRWVFHAARRSSRYYYYLKNSLFWLKESLFKGL